MKHFSRHLVIALLFAVSAAAQATTIDAVLDLERGYNSGLMEGHVGPSAELSPGVFVLENDVNTLPLNGQNLLLETTQTATSPTTLELEMSVYSDDGSDVFVNTIVAGDVVQFGGEFLLGGAYNLDSYNIKVVGISGALYFINEIDVLYLEGNGSALDPFGIELQFDGLDFTGVSEVRLSANFSAVPVPGALWLLGSALAGLGWMRRR